MNNLEKNLEKTCIFVKADLVFNEKNFSILKERVLGMNLPRFSSIDGLSKNGLNVDIRVLDDEFFSNTQELAIFAFSKIQMGYIMISLEDLQTILLENLINER